MVGNNTDTLIMGLVVLPLIILIALAVITQFSSSTIDTFEGTAIVGELIGNNTTATSGGSFSAIYGAEEGSTVTVWNTSGITQTECASTLYNVTYNQGMSLLSIAVGDCARDTASSTDTAYHINYTPLSQTGWSQYVDTVNGTNDGFDLASMLPFIIIAVTVVSIVLVAFGMQRL